MNENNNSEKADKDNYLAAYFYRAPEKNHDAISQNLKKFIPWFVSNGVRLEYYHLDGKMMTDKSLEPLGNEFFSLITEDKKLITGMFNRLEH